jgi:hypothetical protein
VLPPSGVVLTSFSYFITFSNLLLPLIGSKDSFYFIYKEGIL